MELFIVDRGSLLETRHGFVQLGLVKMVLRIPEVSHLQGNELGEDQFGCEQEPVEVQLVEHTSVLIHDLKNNEHDDVSGEAYGIHVGQSSVKERLAKHKLQR